MVYLKLSIFFVVATVFGAAFFLFGPDRDVAVVKSPVDEPVKLAADLPDLPEPEAPTSSLLGTVSASPGDAPPQPQLAEIPEKIKGVYVTGWIAGSKTRLKPIIKLVNDTELNAVVVDIKDYSGYVSYRTGLPEIQASGAEKEPRIIYPNRVIEELHRSGIYVIGRITVFQDSILTKARPELAIKDGQGNLWKDRKGLHWLDPASKEAWDYHIAIARNALDRGFDEINFDYIRFPSDGPLADAVYPVWNQSTTRAEVIRGFFEYLDGQLAGARISADLFGLATISRDDLGIGQKIEHAYPYFDAVMPMVYPSHYSYGFLGYRNPADYPYEVVRHSMNLALGRRETMTRAASSTPLAKLRPWLQSFDLGAIYDSAKIAAQIQAVDDALGDSEANGGWVLWDPKNTYVNYKN